MIGIYRLPNGSLVSANWKCTSLTLLTERFRSQPPAMAKGNRQNRIPTQSLIRNFSLCHSLKCFSYLENEIYRYKIWIQTKPFPFLFFRHTRPSRSREMNLWFWWWYGQNKIEKR
jgi:hypothetical protein